jgi:hypothetical protein
MQRVLLTIATAGVILSAESLMLNRVKAMPLGATAGARVAIEDGNIAEQVGWVCQVYCMHPNPRRPCDAWGRTCWFQKERAYVPLAPAHPHPPSWQGQRFQPGPYRMPGGYMPYGGR